MRKICKVGTVSAMWEYAAYDVDADPGFIGYFGNGNPPAIVDAYGQVLLKSDEYEVVSVDERAWD